MVEFFIFVVFFSVMINGILGFSFENVIGKKNLREIEKIFFLLWIVEE